MSLLDKMRAKQGLPPSTKKTSKPAPIVETIPVPVESAETKPKKLKEPRKPHELDKIMRDRKRLPAESEFYFRWTGEIWIATLTIPGCPIFKTEQSSVIRLPLILDSMYRAWLEKREPTT